MRKRKYENLIGKQFNQLSVLSEAPYKRGYRRWNCLCTCGNEIVITTGNLNAGAVSCGCKQLEDFKNRPRQIKHGMHLHPLYGTWCHMHYRCENKTSPDYKRYGARGITVCPEWNDIHKFIEDMGPKPSSEYSVERINNNEGYNKDNCKWGTRKEQANNRRQPAKCQS